MAEKVREEIVELEEATTPEARQAELGDLLHAVVNWARWLDVDPETALRLANARFARRFGRVEEMVRQRGREMVDLTMEELEALWQETKLDET